MSEYKTKFKKYEIYQMEGDYQGKLVGKSDYKETAERLLDHFKKVYPNKTFKLFTFVR